MPSAQSAESSRERPLIPSTQRNTQSSSRYYKLTVMEKGTPMLQVTSWHVRSHDAIKKDVMKPRARIIIIPRRRPSWNDD
mmetsp:Transcript_42035/g.119347  ORF Transcript_42035/g.119347 Transcript_42035/m.119347 type:complete len:80 (-) Transcript_42035:492-731(-)